MDYGYLSVHVEFGISRFTHQKLNNALRLGEVAGRAKISES